MNLKDRYRAKLLEHMFHQEQEQEQQSNVDQYVELPMHQSKQQKLKQLLKNINQKKHASSNQNQKRTKNILNQDKQNQGDMYNKNEQNKRKSNSNILHSQHYKYQINKKIMKKQPDSLLELSQIQNDHKLTNIRQKPAQIVDNYSKNKQEKKKKARFIDKIKHINQENSSSICQNHNKQDQKQQTIQQNHKKEIMKQQEKQCMNMNMNMSMNEQQESTLTNQIRKDKSVIPLFKEFSFNFTIDIQISSGVKVPLEVNQKSNIKLLSQQFVKKHNLTSFDHLAQLLQKEIQHQIQKQKKQKICSKYTKTAQKYQKIASKNQIQQVLIDSETSSNLRDSIQVQLCKNYNSSSLQQVEEAQYINLCTKQPFLIPHQLYQKAKQKKYTYKQKQSFQSIQDQKFDQKCYSQDQRIVESIKDSKDWSQNLNQNQQKMVQQNQNSHKSDYYQNVSQKNDFQIRQSASFNYLNCFDKIQDIKIQKNKVKNMEVKNQQQQNSQQKLQNFFQKQNSHMNSQSQEEPRKFQNPIKQLILPRNKRIQNLFMNNNKNISRIQDYCKINHQSKQLQSDTVNFVQQEIQQDNHQQNKSFLNQEYVTSAPRINIISQQIVNRLGKNNILIQKRKKNNFIKESILIERQQKLQKQLEQCSFKPKINLISKFIDKKVKLSQFLQNNNTKETRQNDQNTQQNNYSFHLQKNKPCKDRFDQLYQNSKVLSNKKQQIRRKSIQEISFRPQINTISKKIMQSKRNSRDLTDSVGKVKNRSESFQFHPQTLFQGKDLTYALDRNLQGLPIGEYLYKQAMKLKKKRQSLQIVSSQNFKTLQTSQKLIQCAKQRKLQQIFDQLSKFSNDGLLYPGDFDLNSPKFSKNSKHSIKYFVPLLRQMQQLQVQLNKDEFIKSALKLFSVLSQTQKAQILNNKKIQSIQNSVQKKQRMISSKKNSLGLLKGQKDDIYFRGLMHRKNFKQKIEIQLQNKVRKELTECTFKPRVKNYQTIE